MFIHLFFILDAGGYTSASKAFIFSFYNAKGYNPVKLTQYQNQQYAMYKEPNYGPSFGHGPDIYISDNATVNQNSSTRCGGTYSFPSGYSTAECDFFTGASHFTPNDIEVFYEIGNNFMFLCWVDVIRHSVLCLSSPVFLYITQGVLKCLLWGQKPCGDKNKYFLQVFSL